MFIKRLIFQEKEVLDAPLIDHAYKTYSKDVKFSGKHLKNRDVLYKFPKEKFTTKSWVDLSRMISIIYRG